MPDTARCPRCGQVSTTPGEGPDAFYCHGCKIYFSAVDDGATSYGDPARIVERRDSFRHRQQRRARGRG
jgi:hypothetical protein